MGISVIGGPVGGASGGNGFSLIVGATGNTTYAFNTPQPAGAYSFTSELGDTTFDIYLISPTNTNAGYANASSALEASGEFDRVVLYGATTNDVINFEFKPSASPATSGDIVDGAAPFLTSATPATMASIDDTTTVTGGNFATDVEIVFTGQDAVVRPAKSIVRSSSTSLIVTRPNVFPVAQEPFSMTATNAGIPNPSVTVNKLTNFFDAGSGIVWVTTSPLNAAIENFAYSVTLEATDADETGVAYSLTTGSLPTGLSLNGSTGVISGTPTVVESETFTITATDAGGNSSAREFTLSVVLPTVEYLVVAGGGGGGALGSGGGGGAGGYRAINGQLLDENTLYPVTVGAGGSRALTSGTFAQKGSNSTFGTITSTGGGLGGGNDNRTGGAGGSGGGSGNAGGGGAGNQGGFTPPEGFNGAGGASHGGGGGGASQNGSSIFNNGDHPGAKGGDGIASSITGTSITRAGGGGSGGRSDPGGSQNGGNGGLGGGGNGGNTFNSPAAQDGQVNRGAGGGGGGTRAGIHFNGANGGSGVVILKYSAALTLTVGAGLTANTPAASGGFKVTTFTAGTGTISFS